jgi:hypothetical protein
VSVCIFCPFSVHDEKLGMISVLNEYGTDPGAGGGTSGAEEPACLQGEQAGPPAQAASARR